MLCIWLIWGDLFVDFQNLDLVLYTFSRPLLSLNNKLKFNPLQAYLAAPCFLVTLIVITYAYNEDIFVNVDLSLIFANVVQKSIVCWNCSSWLFFSIKHLIHGCFCLEICILKCEMSFFLGGHVGFKKPTEIESKQRVILNRTLKLWEKQNKTKQNIRRQGSVLD